MVVPVDGALARVRPALGAIDEWEEFATRCLEKYPGSFLSDTVAAVWLCGAITVDDVHAGSVCVPSRRCVFATSPGRRGLRAPGELEREIHAGIARLVLASHPEKLGRAAWSSLRAEGDRVVLPSPGGPARTPDELPVSTDAGRLARGYVSSRAETSIENDFIAIASRMMTSAAAFRPSREASSCVEAKARLVEEFYAAVLGDPSWGQRMRRTDWTAQPSRVR